MGQWVNGWMEEWTNGIWMDKRMGWNGLMDSEWNVDGM